MPDRFPPIVAQVPHMLHGADYNPDQWPPHVWDEDMKLMRAAGCNAMAVGIFSWAHLEPAEGAYTFEWLDTVMDLLADSGAVALLATPSAAPPAWMTKRYPEILRVGPDRVRRLHGNRVNNCWSSPVYRDKCRTMTTELARRYANHPALGAWHLYNEYGGECYCELCAGAFRRWLRAKFADVQRLNEAYWTPFWGHDYSDFDQIAPPGAPYGERAIMGLTLDWRRFVTDQVVDFLRNEAAVVREVTPGTPVTTNMMGFYPGLNYWKFADDLDVASWDSYPTYHDREGDWRLASFVSMTHDFYRTLKAGRPFMLMESTPSSANWFELMKLKRPGVHRLASLQAVAHGSDTVQYFQWRQSRGGSEKFHGAVVSHGGAPTSTRVFNDVAEVGELLARLDAVVGTSVRPDVALVYDWENSWAIDAAQGPHREPQYMRTVADWYRAFWKRGIPVDIPESTADFSRYKLVVAPMLYMLRPGVADSVRSFVADGGTFVTTYWSGIVDENDLCYQGGFPGPLRDVLGVWSEELDVLYEDESTNVAMGRDNPLGIEGTFEARRFCDLIHTQGADVVASYASQFYAGRPALTVNRWGAGAAWYVAFRPDWRFLDAFSDALARNLDIASVLDASLPEGVTAQVRTDGTTDFVFVLNFTRLEHTLQVSGPMADAVSGKEVGPRLRLVPYDARVLTRPAR